MFSRLLKIYSPFRKREAGRRRGGKMRVTTRGSGFSLFSSRGEGLQAAGLLCPAINLFRMLFRAVSQL